MRKPQVIWGGGGGGGGGARPGGSAHPLHIPPRTAPELVPYDHLYGI